VEILAPPPLAVLLILATGATSDRLSSVLLGFPYILLAAYAYGMLPSILYAVAMEFWFENRLHARCGALATVALSALLGAVAGFVIQSVLVQELTLTYFLPIGALVGLIIGIYIFLLCRGQ